MIVIEQLQSIDDDTFDALYEASSPHLDAGSYPWELQTGVDTYEQKKARFKVILDSALNNPFKESVIVWGTYKDGRLVMLNVSYKEEDTYVWILSLVAPDDAGSRAFLYSTEYAEARTSFWKSLGLTRWIVECCGPGTPIYLYQQKAHSTGAIEENVIESSKFVAGVEFTRFEYTIN